MRTAPYKDVTKAKCVHCGEKAAHSWLINLCSMNNKPIQVAVCTPCDIAYNDFALRFIRHPNYERLIEAYRSRVS